jgi:hypothetical protein
MDGQLNNDSEVMCCFCGKTLRLQEAAIISIQLNIQSAESQQFFCHKRHLVEVLDKSIPLHPDFFDEEDD